MSETSTLNWTESTTTVLPTGNGTISPAITGLEQIEMGAARIQVDDKKLLIVVRI